jgi:putative intracellular protease/amidase
VSANLNTASVTPKRILMVVANPGTSTTVGGPVGFWASELTHAWYEFVEAGYQVDLASPQGGRVVLDAMSDPRDASGYSAHDLISMGFLNTPNLTAMLDATRPIAAVTVADYDALVVAGGQSPMFTFPQDTALHRFVEAFWNAGKVVAALCHGVAALLYAKLPDGTPLIRGRQVTGFANSEEDFADAWMKTKVMPFRIEDEARKLGANYVAAPAFRAFAVRDGRLITGQQQYSGRATAALVIETLGR